MPETGPEKNYQLEAKNEKSLSPEEQKALEDINKFLQPKNYKEWKTVLDAQDANDQLVKNIQEQYKKIKEKVKEKQTTIGSTSTKERKMIVDRPNTHTEIRKENLVLDTEAQLDNSWQEKWKVEYIDQEQIKEIVENIKNNIMDPKFSVTINWRSDANIFLPWPTANTLIVTYNALRQNLWNDMPDAIKTKFSTPTKPENPTEKQMSDWLNTILAQARALRSLELIKNNIWINTFKTMLEKGNTNINIQPYLPTLEGQDRWTSIVCKRNMQTEDITTTTNPTQEIKEIVKQREHFEFYTAIKFTYPDGRSIYKMFQRSMNVEHGTGKPITLHNVWNWRPINITKNADGSTIPTDIGTSKYKNISEPNIEEIAKKDRTHTTSVMEKTTVKNPDGTFAIAQEYTTMPATKTTLPTIAYPLKNWDISTYWETTKLISLIDKTYPINNMDDIKLYTIKQPSEVGGF